jgi:S-adenosyl-L-methionine hydrolase (adenosine-forming)
MSIVTLTTDFGLDDWFVGELKAVLLSGDPRLTVVDLCHAIQAQDVRAAAFMLYAAYDAFPPGTIHIVGVDAAGGTGSDMLLVETDREFFLAPDNGALHLVLTLPRRSSGNALAVRRIVRLDSAAHWRQRDAGTFRARDILAPIAAQLSQGASPTTFGTVVSKIVGSDLPRVSMLPDGSIEGAVIHIDRFGNAITNVARPQLPGWPVTVRYEDTVIETCVTRYDGVEPGHPLVIVGSADLLEISIREGSAAQALGLRRDDRLTITRT